MTRPVRILLVEDRIEWRSALRRMYQEIFSPGEVICTLAANSDEAVDALQHRDGMYDLLSLDLLLGGTDGRTVLRVARQTHAVRAVAVITGFDQAELAEEFQVVVPDRHQRRVASMTMDAYIQELFPGNHLYLRKDLTASIEENVEVFAEVLAGGRLLGLIRPEHVMRREGDHWCVSYSGRTVRPASQVGFALMAHLLAHPHQRFSCVELEQHVAGVALAASSTNAALEAVREGHLAVSRLPTTTAETRDRMADLRRWQLSIRRLEDELESGPVSSTREAEIHHLIETYAQLIRGSGSTLTKRVNDRVRAALRRANRWVERNHPELAGHLESALKVGSECAYLPPHPIRWDTVSTDSGPD